MTPCTIYLNGQAVGHVANGVYHRKARRSAHFFRKLKGWAYEVGTLRQAADKGAEMLELYDAETGRTYRAKLRDFEQYGREINFPGWGRQIVLEERYWHESGQPVQQSLFGLAGVRV